MSSSDEDVHQCGRCKEIFNSIDVYFAHKKAKSCQKVSSPHKKATEGLLVVSNSDLTSTGGTGASLEGHGVHTEPETEGLLTNEKYDQSSERGQSESRERISSNQRKAAPKKVWVEHYENEEVDVNVEGGKQEGTVLPLKRKRGRPRKDDQFVYTSEVKGTYGRVHRNPRGRPRGRGRRGGSVQRKDSEFPKFVKDEEAETSDEENGSGGSQKEPKFMKREEQVCSICNYVAYYEDEFDRHLRKVHNLSKYVCKECGSAFRDKYKLHRHVTYDKCQKTVSKHQEYGVFPKHSQSITIENLGSLLEIPEDEGVMKLRKRLPIKKQIKEWESSGSEEEKGDAWDGVADYNCKECSDQFSDYEGVREHVRRAHLNILPGICRFCGKWFMSKYKLWRHMTSSVHDNVSDVAIMRARNEITKCKIQMKEGQSRYLRSMKSRAFPCPKCCDVFLKKFHLIKHLAAAHRPVGIKKFTCESCGERFGKRCHYMKHMRKDHGIDQIGGRDSCPTCKKEFKQRNHVFRHIETLHTPVAQAPMHVLEKLEGEVLQSGLVDDVDVHTCFICCKQLVSEVKLKRHYQLHRQWVMVLANGKVDHGGIDVLYDNLYSRDPLLMAMMKGNIITDAFKPSVTESGHQEQDATDQLTGRSAQMLDQGQPGGDDDDDRDKMALVTVGDPAQGKTQDAMTTLDELVQEQTVLSLLQQIGDSIPSGVVEGPSSQESDARMSINTPPPSGDLQESAAPAMVTDMSSVFIDHGQKAAAPPPAQSDDRQVCPYCLENFQNLEEVYEHKVRVHQLALVFKCLQQNCKKVFQKLDHFKEHDGVHRQVAFICRICNEHFDELVKVVGHKSSAHRAVNAADSSVKCAICQKAFASRPDLKDHYYDGTHATYACSQCDKVFKGEAELEEHREAHDAVGSFLCDFCGATFGSGVALKRHRAMHVTERVHKCEHCGADFNKKEHLRRHVATKHTQEKPYACKFADCTKAFNRKDKLQDHYKTHTNAKPYVCQFCSKSYRYREGLKYHEKTHQRELKFFCTLCEMGFIKPGMLRNHLQTAHGLNLKENHCYPCGKCGLIFARPERLKRHMEREHGLETQWKYECHLCKRGFPGVRSLNTHMRRRHYLGEGGESLGPDAAQNARKRKPKEEVSVAEVDDAMSAVDPASLDPPSGIEPPQVLTQAPVSQIEMVRMSPGGGNAYATTMQLSTLPAMANQIILTPDQLQQLQSGGHPHTVTLTIPQPPAHSEPLPVSMEDMQPLPLLSTPAPSSGNQPQQYTSTYPLYTAHTFEQSY